jgi:ferric-dicitrate binding protein FerR (iron transport regulator)
MADALAAWQGAPVAEARRAELLARLRTDDGFRKEFSEAVWTLSMAQVAQAPEPRWLGLSEELGLLGYGEETAGDDAEQAIMAEIRRKPHRLQVSGRWRTMAMAAAGLAALLMFFLLTKRDENPAPQRNAGAVPEPSVGAVPDERKLAVLTGEARAVWESEPFIAGGKWLRPGTHRLLSGSETLVFSDGTRVRLQAPVDFSLVDGTTISCRRGAVRVTMADGTDGFRVEVPFGMVTDQGTDFAVEVGENEATRVAVFEGKVELAIRQPENDGMRLLSMAGGEAIGVAADGSTHPADAMDLPPPPNTAMPPLQLPEAYAERILAGKPRHYWRLNRMENGEIPDETGNGNPLVAVGKVTISPDAGGRSILRLTGDGGLVSRSPWRLRREGAALEMWFLSEGNPQSALAALAQERADSRHFALLGHNNNYRSEGFPERTMSNSLRFLTRWPADVTGGMTLFSEPVYGPMAWHHVVIQIQGRRMELHANGMQPKVATADEMPEIIELFPTFGFAYTKRMDVPDGDQADRFLIGRMAEIAVYDRALSREEILERYGRMAE